MRLLAAKVADDALTRHQSNAGLDLGKTFKLPLGRQAHSLAHAVVGGFAGIHRVSAIIQRGAKNRKNGLIEEGVNHALVFADHAGDAAKVSVEAAQQWPWAMRSW